MDALSATGLRALRYSLEIPYATSVTANDLDAGAVKAIKHNVDYNAERAQTVEPETLTSAAAMAKIRVNEGNARNHMYGVLAGSGSGNGPSADRHKYEVIDLDPYGSAAPFLDAAVQAVSNGGLLCITCTDPGVWASVGYSEKCFSLYGGLPVKGDWCHEAGLRLILHATATSAARYGLSIEPLLSLSIDYYARVFVRVRKSPAQVKNLASTTMTVYNCDEGCGSWYEQHLGKAKEVTGKSGKSTYMKYGLARAPTVGHSCPECDSPMHVS